MTTYRSLVCLVLATTVAHAEPTFVSLDRVTGTSHAGAHLGLMLFEDQDSDGGAPSLQQPRLQLFGSYAITPNVGVIASASVIWFRSEPTSELGLGATYIGGYGRYVLGDFELVGRASLVLPTETYVPRDSYYEDVAVHGTLFPFLEERTIDAGAWWVQAGASVRFRHSGVSAQLDAFVDVPLSGGPYEDDSSRGDPIRLHLGAGVAYTLAANPYHAEWRLGAELLVSGYHWADQLYGDLEADEGVWYGLTISAARKFSVGEGVVWFSNPLDQYLRSRWHAFGVGYQRAL